MVNKEIAEISMNVIAFSGNARGKIYEALDACAEGDFDLAEKLLEEAGDEMQKAHKAQFKLLSREASGEDVPISILLIHAQDILMATISERDLVRSLMEIWKKKSEM